MTESDIKAIVSDILNRRFPDGLYDGSDVSFANDFDGESIIRVTARYRTRPAARSELIGTVHDIRDALIARGEERFVFLTNDVVDERQTSVDVD